MSSEAVPASGQKQKEDDSDPDRDLSFSSIEMEDDTHWSEKIEGVIFEWYFVPFEICFV